MRKAAFPRGLQAAASGPRAAEPTERGESVLREQAWPRERREQVASPSEARVPGRLARLAQGPSERLWAQRRARLAWRCLARWLAELGA